MLKKYVHGKHCPKCKAWTDAVCIWFFCPECGYKEADNFARLEFVWHSCRRKWWNPWTWTGGTWKFSRVL